MIWFEKNFIPVPEKYEASKTTGFSFATKIAEKAQFISLLFNISGWVLIMLGILLGVAGSVLGTDAIISDKDAWTRLLAQRGLICNTFAIIIAGVGRQFLERAKATAMLASTATTAIATSSKEKLCLEGDDRKPDRVAYDDCVLAKTIWLEGRVDDKQLNAIASRLGQDKVKG